MPAVGRHRVSGSAARACHTGTVKDYVLAVGPCGPQRDSVWSRTCVLFIEGCARSCVCNDRRTRAVSAGGASSFLAAFAWRFGGGRGTSGPPGKALVSLLKLSPAVTALARVSPLLVPARSPSSSSRDARCPGIVLHALLWPRGSACCTASCGGHGGCRYAPCLPVLSCV